MNSCSLISPHAMANSAWRTRPRPQTWPSIGNVVGWVGKDELGFGALKQDVIRGFLACVCRTAGDVFPDPEIASVGTWVLRKVRRVVLWPRKAATALCGVLEDPVDLGALEPGRLEIKVEVDEGL